MPPAVFGLLILAGLLHVGWNVLVKTGGDPLHTVAQAATASLVVVVPLATAGWFVLGRPEISPQFIALAVLSGLLEVVYFVFLSAAYRRGGLSVVYPIARGTAPLLAAAVGVIILGERLGYLGAAGLAGVLLGLLAIRRPWLLIARAGRSGENGAVLFALVTGLTIATYSGVDRVGAQLGPPWLYGAMLWTVCSLGLAAWVGFLDRRFHLAGRRVGFANSGESVQAEPWRRAALIGLLLVASYQLVLVGLSLAPLSAVSPVRESAIVFASGWGTLRLGEATDRKDAAWRLGGAVLILGGVALLAVEGQA